MVERRYVLATHVAWLRASGAPVPRGMVILHTCDTPGCVRNDEPGDYTLHGVVLPRYGHLVLGKKGHNNTDCMLKGRQARGERNSQSRLTDNIVREARSLHRDAAMGCTSLARRYGVSEQAMWQALTGRSWKHVV